MDLKPLRERSNPLANVKLSGVMPQDFVKIVTRLAINMDKP